MRATKICDRNVFIDTVRIVGQPFSPTGWRNTPLPADAPIDPKSAELIGDIHWQLANPVQRSNGTTAPDVWVTYDRFSVPVYVVNKDGLLAGSPTAFYRRCSRRQT